MNALISAGIALIGAAVGIAGYICIRRIIMKGRKDSIIEKAELEAENIKKEKILQAKEKFLQLKSAHEQQVNEKNAQLRDAENRIRQKENSLNQQSKDLQRKIAENDSLKASLASQKESLEKKAEEYEALRKEANKQIESIAGLTAAEAKNILMENMKAEARSEAQAYINDTMDDARLNAAKEAKRIVITTIQRTATETAIENAVTTFPIENDEIKGRIIGREGRNI
ncbi:MAG: Rnase Y domain-containing protein, partial [Candidatus Cryptobacteroides sp.]